MLATVRTRHEPPGMSSAPQSRALWEVLYFLTPSPHRKKLPHGKTPRPGRAMWGEPSRTAVRMWNGEALRPTLWHFVQMFTWSGVCSTVPVLGSNRRKPQTRVYTETVHQCSQHYS